MKNNSTPPKHISKEAKGIWRGLLDEYEITDIAGIQILQASLEAFDRAQAARKAIDMDGMTIVDKFNQVKPHVLIACERDSRAAFLAGLKHLNLDLEMLRDGPGRPPGR